MRVLWIKPEELIIHEFTQAREEGRDVAAFVQEWEKYRAVTTDPILLRQKAEQLMGEMAVANGYDPEDEEPTVYGDILRQCPQEKTELSSAMDEAVLLDKTRGGWLGRAAGCLLGKPVEGKPRAWIRQLLESNGEWPLHNYFTAQGVPPELFSKYTWHKSYKEALRENIVCMPEDDDMNYPMLNLHIAEFFGPDFNSDDVLQSWLVNLPVLQVFTAERVAYLNALKLLTPPETAVFQNPYREWIGAQIRADFWGWICPGNPSRAAELAYRDGAVSHVKNGIYGEMFFAAVIAASFSVQSPKEAIMIGLEHIPERCRLAQAVHFTLELYTEEPNFEKAVDVLYEKYGHYHWVHTINNAALAVSALLYGDNDLEKTITNAVMGGWDTDCNGATVGSIIGVLHGAKDLPDKWIGPLHNLVRTSLHGFDKSSFDDLAERTIAQTKLFQNC